MIPLDPNSCYGAQDVAHIVFGRTVRWFYEHRARLERTEFFPRPISKVGHPRWSGAALIEWIQRPREDYAGGGSANVTSINTLLRARAKLVAQR